MKIVVRYFAFWVVLFFAEKSFAQQGTQFTHHMYNKATVNPAVAGSNAALHAGLLNRVQWIGIGKAPVSNAFYMHSPVRAKNMNIGITATNDVLGPAFQTKFAFQFAYAIPLSRRGDKLAFGLEGGLNFVNLELSTLRLNDEDDVLFEDVRSFVPSVGVGLYYYSERFYLGFSSPKLSQKVVRSTNKMDESKLVPTYYGMAGYVFNYNHKFKIKPAFLLKFSENTPLTVDLSVEFYFGEKLSLGSTYRYEESYGALVGLRLTPQFRLGFSYDYSLPKFAKYNFGTAEMLLQYDFVFKKDRVLSPRFF
jgi:type IX secretion system PorP/SprF family membrane protein